MKLVGMTRSLTAEVSCEGFDRESGAKNLLAKMIMHLFADTPLLAVSGIQESVLQKPRFGRVADRQKETTAVAANLKSPHLHRHNRAILRPAKNLALGNSVVGDGGQAIFKVPMSSNKGYTAPHHF